MTEKATVIEINDKLITLSCGDKASCSACSGNSFCNVKTNSFKALNNQDITLFKGDEVQIYLPTGRTIFAGFIVMIVPLIMFILFFQAAGSIFNVTSEGIKALYGIAGLAAGFGLSFIYNKLRRQQDMPLVISKVLK